MNDDFDLGSYLDDLGGSGGLRQTLRAMRLLRTGADQRTERGIGDRPHLPRQLVLEEAQP
jgi:hypothetical protein